VPRYLAIDLGAESGRMSVGELSDGRLALEEAHRFENIPVRLPDGLYWDALRIFHEIKQGLRRAASTFGGIDSIGICTWGVDFALLDRSGKLVSNPMHYRDGRTERGMRAVAERLSRHEIYARTGIQFMPINTLNQLATMLDEPQLDVADALLLVPDLFDYWLSGEKLGERTFASTTQIYDVTSREWSWPLIDAMGFPRRLFQELVDPGKVIGPLLPDTAREAAFPEPPAVVTTASHDTASAVVAAPGTGNFAYISSGTWSLVGVELPDPVLTNEAREANFTNEEGFGATTRFLKNVMGLWILQESRRTWAQAGYERSYDELVRVAEAAPAFASFIDPDDSSFLAPGDMPGRIRAFHERTGQRPASEVGAVARCILESLALKYHVVLEQAEKLAGRSIDTVHIVGGGARNHLLNQMVADASGLHVSAGPTEATSLGNLLVQAYAGGELSSVDEMRSVVRASVEVAHYEPASERAAWDEAFERFSGLVAAPA